MQKSPLISVIMSVYNGEKFLVEAIDSILNQTFQDFELIIYDDASTDSSLEILQNYEAKDYRIRLFYKEKNIGLKGFIENLNLGISVATGKYIARMDQDDISLPNRLEKQFSYLENNPTIFMVGAQLDFINERGEITGEKLAELSHGKISEKMPKTISMFHPVIMFRNHEFLLYREKMIYCEDYDLYLRLITEGKILSNLEEKLLKYRVLDHSMSRVGNKFVRRLFVEKALDFYKQRLMFKKDDYENFLPEHLENLTQQNYNSTIENLKLGIKTAIKYAYKKELSLLIEIIKKRNLAGFSYAKIINTLPNSAFLLYSKLYNKI